MGVKMKIALLVLGFTFQFVCGKTYGQRKSKLGKDILVIKNDKIYRNDTLLYNLKDNTVKIKIPDVVVNVKQKNYVNIVAFGATPDLNSDDDGVALQKAIDNLHSKGGGTLFFPAGRYRFSNCGNGDREYGPAGLKIYSNTYFLFEKGAVLERSTQGSFMYSGEEILKNVIFSNGTFDFAHGRQNNEGDFLIWRKYDNCFAFKNVQYLKIENCSFFNVGNDAITIFGNNSKYVEIIDCVFNNIFDNAISVQSGVSYCNISNNVITRLAGDGIVMKGNNSIISGNYIADIKYNTKKIFASGIALGPDKIPTLKVIVTNNIINDVSNYGIINDRSRYSVIASNVILNCANASIKLGWDAHSTIICNNSFLYAKYGIRMDSHNCVVINNQFKFYSKASKVGNMLKSNSFNSWIDNVFVK